MPSRKRAEPLDRLEVDLAASPADHAAMWRARAHNAMDPHQYLEFLLAFTRNQPPSREANSNADEPFSLD